MLKLIHGFHLAWNSSNLLLVQAHFSPATVLLTFFTQCTIVGACDFFPFSCIQHMWTYTLICPDGALSTMKKALQGSSLIRTVVILELKFLSSAQIGLIFGHSHQLWIWEPCCPQLHQPQSDTEGCATANVFGTLYHLDRSLSPVFLYVPVLPYSVSVSL